MGQNIQQNHNQTISDELESLILREILLLVRNHNLPRVLDLRCGNGELSALMAEQGAQVFSADAASCRETVLARKPSGKAGGSLSFIVMDNCEDFPPKEAVFDLIFCHHGVHSIPYADARQFLCRVFRQHLAIGGKLYISAYGLHSDLCEGYADAEERIENRFCPLAPAIAKRYNLKDSICLYTERNLVNLLFEAGGSVLRSFTTTHGTVKAVAVRV